MFTLGDVADILDSALDTGISIVDALAKLSDLADEGALSSAKSLDFGSTSGHNVYDENGNIISANGVGYINNGHNGENNLNIPSCDDSGMCSGSSLNVSNNSYNVPLPYINDCLNTPETPVSCASGQIPPPHEKNTSGISEPEVSQSIAGSSDDVLQDTFQRCGTYVLQTTKNRKSVEDNSLSEHPVFQAFDNLCHVADDVLKYNQGNCTHNGSSITDITEYNSDELNLKVNDMLHSFQKLDETVEKLKQQAMQRHLTNHPEDKDLLVAHRQSTERIHNLPSSDPSTPVSRRKQKHIIERPNTYIVDDYLPSMKNNYTSCIEQKNQDPELFFNIQGASLYTRQASQETYILDDDPEYNDKDEDINMSSSDEKASLKNENENRKPKDAYVLLHSAGNMKSKSQNPKSNLCDANIDLVNSEPNVQMVANAAVMIRQNNKSAHTDILKRKTLPFYQDNPSNLSEMGKCKLENELVNEQMYETEIQSPETAQTIDRNSNHRNTYILHKSPPKPSTPKVNGVGPESAQDNSVQNSNRNLTYTNKKSLDSKNTVQSNRQTYILCQSDSSEKVKQENEIKLGDINLKNNVMIGDNKIVQNCLSLEKSTKSDITGAVVSSEPFTRSDVRSTYILSRTDNDTQKCKDRKTTKTVCVKYNKDLNGEPDGEESICTSECGGGNRSTYVLIDPNKNKSHKKKSVSSKQKNSDFFKKANNNNEEVMFFVGRKQNGDNEDEEVQSPLNTEHALCSNLTSLNNEKNVSSRTGFIEVSLQLTETFDNSTLSASDRSSDTNNKANKDSTNAVEDFELFYKVNNSKNMENMVNLNDTLEKVEKSNNISQDKDLDSKQRSESFEEFELIYEIAIPTNKTKTNRNDDKDGASETFNVIPLIKNSTPLKDKVKSNNNCAFMIPIDNSCMPQLDGVTNDNIAKKNSDILSWEISHCVISRENTFVKEDNVDCNKIAAQTDIMYLKSRENTFIKDELSVDSIETEGTSRKIMTDISTAILDESLYPEVDGTSSPEIIDGSSEILDNPSFNYASSEICNDILCDVSTDTSSENHDTSAEEIFDYTKRSNSAMFNPKEIKLSTRAASLDTLIDNSYSPSSDNRYRRSYSIPTSSEIKSQSHMPRKGLFQSLGALQTLMSSSLTKLNTLNTLNFFHEKTNSCVLTSHENIIEEVTCKGFNNTDEPSLDLGSMGAGDKLMINDHEHVPCVKSSTPTSTPQSFDLADETYSLTSATCSEKIGDNSYEERSFSPETYTIQSKTSSVEEIPQFDGEWSEDIDISIDEQSHDSLSTNINHEKNKFLPVSGLFFSSEDNLFENGFGTPSKSSVCRSDTFVVSPRDEKKLKYNPNLGVSRNDTFLIDKNSKYKQPAELKHKQTIELDALCNAISNNRHCYSAINEYHCNDQVNISQRPLSAGSSQMPKTGTVNPLRRKSASFGFSSEADKIRAYSQPISFFYTFETSTTSTSMTTTNKDLPANQKLTYSNEYISTKPIELNSKDVGLFYSPEKTENEKIMCSANENNLSVKIGNLQALEQEVSMIDDKTSCSGNIRRMFGSKPIHTNFLRRKSKGFPRQRLLNKENEDETLSIQLASLRMQLEEKRRKFDEEKKRKQEQWREERAKNLQNAFFIMLNNEEQKSIDFSLANMEMDNWQESICEPQLITDLGQEEVKLEGNIEETSSNMQIGKHIEKGTESIKTENKECYSNEQSYAVINMTVPEKNVTLDTTTTLETYQRTGSMDGRIPPEVDDQPLTTLIQEFSHFSTDESFQNKPVAHPTSLSFVLNELGNTDAHLSTVNQVYSPEISTVLNEINSSPQELMSAEYDSNINNIFHPNMIVNNNDVDISSLGTNNSYTLSNSELQGSNHINIPDKVPSVREMIENPKVLSFIEQEQVPSATIDAVLAQVGTPVPSFSYRDIVPCDKASDADKVMHSNIPLAMQCPEEIAIEETIAHNEVPIFENNLPLDEIPNEYVPTHVNDEQIPLEQLQTSHIVIADDTRETQSIVPEKVSDVLSQENIAKTPSAMTFVVGIDMMGTPELTPQQIKKRERFLRQRQKNIEEEREKKAAEFEKKQRMEEFTPKKVVKEERPKESGNWHQESFGKKIANEQIPQETPVRKVKREPITPRTPRTLQHAPATPTTTPTSSSVPNDETSRFLEYTGPDAYKKPSGKSNRKIIQNAIMHCCLCGEVNKESKKKCLEALEKSEANHFLVLFREGLKFRSVYEYHPESEMVVRVYGIGPKNLTDKMVTKYYKYNSGGKEFYSLETKHLSIQVDGLMIKKELWEKKQGNSKTDSNLKKFLSSK